MRRFAVDYAAPRDPPLLVGALGAAAGLVVVGLFVVGSLVPAILLGVLAAGAMARLATRPKPMRAELGIGATAVHLGEATLVDRADLAGAFLAETEHGCVVDLWTSRRSLAQVHLASVARGRELVEALGFGAGRRVAILLPGTARAAALGLLVAGAAVTLGCTLGILFGRPGLGFLVSLAFAVPILALQSITSRRIELGVDGLRFTSREGLRFVAFAEIEAARAIRRPVPGLELQLASGEVVRIDTGSRPGQHRALAEGLADLVARSLHPGQPGPEVPALRRGRRDVTGWVRELRGLASGAGADHRHAPPSVDRLWEALRRGDSHPVERAAAAVALAGEPAHRAELVRLAAGVAAPRVRFAIERAVEGADDEELGEALAAVEEAAGDDPVPRGEAARARRHAG